MKVLNINEIEQVNGGIPLFLAIALYGEIAVFSATVSALLTHRALTE